MNLAEFKQHQLYFENLRNTFNIGHNSWVMRVRLAEHPLPITRNNLFLWAEISKTGVLVFIDSMSNYIRYFDKKSEEFTNLTLDQRREKWTTRFSSSIPIWREQGYHPDFRTLTKLTAALNYDPSRN